jgi:hypothetical protein
METRKTDPVTALEHVLTVVLNDPLSDPPLMGPFRRAMEVAGAAGIGDLLMLRDEDFKDMIIPDYVLSEALSKDLKPTLETRTRSLTVVERRTFEQLSLWFRSKSAENPTIAPSRIWFLLTPEDFKLWMQSYHAPISTTSEPSSIGGDLVTIEDKQRKRDLENFNKGVRRDESAFKVFKEDQYYLLFHRNLLVTARSQNVERAFDLDFDPSSLVDKLERELYDQQVKFAYSVLSKIVQTSQGRIFVRQHEVDGNATAVLRKIVAFYTQSRVAEKASSDLQTKILALRFDSTWNSGAKNFLNHWQNLVLDLEEIRGTGSTVAVSEKRPWLVTSLSTNSKMEEAITQWDSSE